MSSEEVKADQRNWKILFLSFLKDPNCICIYISRLYVAFNVSIGGKFPLLQGMEYKEYHFDKFSDAVMANKKTGCIRQALNVER